MNTTPTIPTTDSAAISYPAYRRTPGSADQLDPQDYTGYWGYASARLDRQREDLAPLWAMSVEQRIAAMRRGELTLTELTRWASRYPEQVPTINGEFEFIAALTPEIAED